MNTRLFFATPFFEGLRVALVAVLCAVILSSEAFGCEVVAQGAETGRTATGEPQSMPEPAASAAHQGVLIEAVVAEVSQEDAADLGINWISGAGEFQTDADVDRVVGSSSVIGSIEKSDLAVLQRKLHTENGSELITTPVVYTLDGEEATVFIGKEVPAGNDQLEGACIKSSTEVGTSLTIKPIVDNDKKILLDVALQVSSVVPGEANCPAVNTEYIHTKVQGNDGDVIVLGSSSNEADSRLMLFLKPNIVDAAGKLPRPPKLAVLP